MCFYFCTSYLSEKEYEPSFNLSYMYKQEEISYYWISSKKMCSEETILSDSKSDPLLVCYHLFQKRKNCMYYVGSRELGNQINDLPQTGRSILADVYILSDLVLFSVSNCTVYLKMKMKITWTKYSLVCSLLLLNYTRQQSLFSYCTLSLIIPLRSSF